MTLNGNRRSTLASIIRSFRIDINNVALHQCRFTYMTCAEIDMESCSVEMHVSCQMSQNVQRLSFAGELRRLQKNVRQTDAAWQISIY